MDPIPKRICYAKLLPSVKLNIAFFSHLPRPALFIYFLAKKRGSKFLQFLLFHRSFGLAFVGTFFMFVSGVLFMVEARIIARKEIARERMYPMEQRV